MAWKGIASPLARPVIDYQLWRHIDPRKVLIVDHIHTQTETRSVAVQLSIRFNLEANTLNSNFVPSIDKG